MKYPRTYHLKHSHGTSDDKILENYNRFFVMEDPPPCPREGSFHECFMPCPDCERVRNPRKIAPLEVVVTLKMDGECTTMTQDKCHARSENSRNHPSRNYVKGIWGQIKHLIPEDYRFCGENMFARHSISYNELEDYFLLFNIWENDTCLDWDSTCEIAREFGLAMVPTIYRGPFHVNNIHNFFLKHYSFHEGYVVRLTSSFKLDDFSTCVGKYVRENHVQTSDHWMSQQIIPNKLRSSNNEEIRPRRGSKNSTD